MDNIPSLFDQSPTLQRRDEAYHSLQPLQVKKQKYRILMVLLKHPLLRYDEIPGWYREIFGGSIKESSIVGRLNELAAQNYVNTDNEKLNCEGKQMVTAYEITQTGLDHLLENNIK